MQIRIPVYEDGEIAVALTAENEKSAEKYMFNLAIRYLPPQTYVRNGEIGVTTNKMGGETDWFIIPSSFGYAIGRKMIEQKVAGYLDGFDEKGFTQLIKWLVEMDEIDSSMTY